MEIPRPFTNVFIEVAEPIFVDAHADAEEIARKRDELQQALENLTASGAAWRIKSEQS